MSCESDIIGGAPTGFLVIGWFTPDYRPLAEKLAANLTEHGAPFHLWEKPKPSGMAWLELILLKPTVVLEAMDAYPDKTIVLMDVDCLVKGDISPMTEITEDVGIAVFSGMFENRPREWRVWLGISTRVVVFKPTEAARRLATRWRDCVQKYGGHEERCMAMAFLSVRDVRSSFIDQRYSAREIGMLPDAVIMHDSAHEKTKRKSRSAFMQLLRDIERLFFRTGRSRATKLQGEMSVVVKV